MTKNFLIEDGAPSALRPQDAPYMLGPVEPGGFPVAPLGQVHMIAGGSGAGKTTLLFQLLDAMQKGKPFFNLLTQPHPTVYVTFDRTEAETKITMTRVWPEIVDVGIVEATGVPVMCLPVVKPPSTHNNDTRLESALQAIQNAHPEARIYVIDGIYTLIPHGQINDYLTVAEWLQRIRNFCERTGITVVGITHSPKQREGQKIIEPRQMLLGSVAGAGFTSFGLVIMRDKPDKEDRTIWFLPRNAAEFKVQVGLDANGLLTEDAIATNDKKFFMYENIIKSLPKDTFTIAELMPGMAQIQASKPATYQWLQELVREGKCRKVRHGVYERVGGVGGVEEGAPAHLPAANGGGE